MKSTLWKIIPSKYRNRAVTVAITIFVRALLNFVGIAMLVPVLMLIMDSDNMSNNQLLITIYSNFHFNSHSRFTIAVCLIAIAVIVLKNILVFILYRFERDFTFALYKELSERLYISYFKRGLGFIKRSNSAILTRNVNVVSLMFVTGILKPIATIIGEILLFILIFGSLVWYAPKAALIAILVFGPAVVLFYAMVRRKLNDIGKRENEAQRVKSKVVADTFRGYADIEINCAYAQMFKRFEQATDEAVKLRKQNANISMLPQMITEIGLMAGMVAIVLISVGCDSSAIRMMFGVFAVAAIRLIPSVRSVMSSWSSIKYNSYAIDIIKDADIEYSRPNCSESKQRFNFTDSIELRDISFIFDDATEPVISNLSLEIKKGEIAGIKGSSGIGKTTLFNLILGLYRPTSGIIAIDNEPLTNDNIRKWQNTIGYVSQNVFIADMTIAENIALGCDISEIDYSAINKVVEMSNLKEFVNSLENGVNTRIGEQGCRLSGGQRQRIGIARALYKNPDILLFDEATSSLDDRTEESINNAILELFKENKSLTIVVIAHRESSLEYCNRVITLE